MRLFGFRRALAAAESFDGALAAPGLGNTSLLRDLTQQATDPDAGPAHTVAARVRDDGGPPVFRRQ